MIRVIMGRISESSKPLMLGIFRCFKGLSQFPSLFELRMALKLLRSLFVRMSFKSLNSPFVSSKCSMSSGPLLKVEEVIISMQHGLGGFRLSQLTVLSTILTFQSNKKVIQRAPPISFQTPSSPSVLARITNQA